VTDNAVDWAINRGWYLDLPSGQQANTRPAVARGAITFVTNVAGASDCSASSYLYVLNVLSGSRYPGATFVGSQISDTANTSGVTAVVTDDTPTNCTGPDCGNGGGGTPPPCQHIVGLYQTGDGTSGSRDITGCVNIPGAKNAWRQVRR
jgi:type IV pilus assembly protein PilY1